MPRGFKMVQDGDAKVLLVRFDLLRAYEVVYSEANCVSQFGFGHDRIVWDAQTLCNSFELLHRLVL